MLEDQAVFAHDLRPGRVLWIVESVLDELEDDVIGGKGENEHDHSPGAFSVLELIFGAVQMAKEVAVEFGFAMFIVTDRHIEFGYALAGHQRFQKTHELIGPFGVHPEVRTSKAEKDGDVVLTREHSVERNSCPAVQQCECQRQAVSVAGSKGRADQVSALPAEENVFDHLDPRYRATQLILQTGGGCRGSCRQVGVPCCGKTQLCKDSREQSGEFGALISALHGAGRIGRWGVKVAVNKLNLLIDTDRSEYTPGQRIEKTLSNFPLIAIRDQRRVNRFDGCPDRLFLEALAHQAVNRHYERVQHPAVEPESLRCVRVGSRPVTA